MQPKSWVVVVQSFSHVDSLRPHGLQYTRLLCPPSPETCSNSCPLSWWCHPTILSSVIPFSFQLQSFPGSESFQMSQFFVPGGQSIGTSAWASVLPMYIQDWFPLELTGLIPGPASYLLWYNWIFLVSPLRVNTSRCFFRTRLWPYSHYALESIFAQWKV